jgi:hypothetical protein
MNYEDFEWRHEPPPAPPVKVQFHLDALEQPLIPPGELLPIPNRSRPRPSPAPDRLCQAYEDMEWNRPETVPLLDSYSGASIVRWYNSIKFKLREMIRHQEANRNFEYADLLRTFSNTWEKNALTGSINRETLDVLKAGSEPYAKMDWNQQTFFAGLNTSLDELIADQEALPTGVDTDQNMPMAGGAGGSMPPLGTDFGPEEEPPGGAPPPGEEGEGFPAAGSEAVPAGEETPGAAPAGGGGGGEAGGLHGRRARPGR